MSYSQYYTPEEDEIIRTYYPTVTQAEIMRMLPNRTSRGIRVRASRLGILKNKESWEVGISLDGSVIGHLTEAEKGYLAGIIDGEGCIMLARHKGSRDYIYHVYITIANTSQKLHEWLDKKLPGRGYMKQATPGRDKRPGSNPEQWRQSYNWIVSGNRIAIVLLKEIAPYLVIKHEQAKLLVNGYVHLPEEERYELYKKLRDLKKTS